MLARLASISLLLVAVPSFAEGDTADVRAARYYAAGLEKPVLLLRAGTQLIAACKGRLRAACSRQQRELAAKDRTLDLLDALALFPERPAVDPAAGRPTAGELKERIASTNAELFRASGEYDEALFARYGAILRVCSDPDVDTAAYRASLDALIRVELTSFQALGADAVAQTGASIANAETSAVAAIRTLPAEDCAAALRIGSHLMELMQGKLEPWMGEERRVADPTPTFTFGGPPKPIEPPVPDRELASSVAGNFVSLVATELELIVHPEKESRFKALADEVELARKPR